MYTISNNTHETTCRYARTSQKVVERFAADINQIRKQVADNFNKLYVKSKFSQKLHNLQKKGGEKNTISQP